MKVYGIIDVSKNKDYKRVWQSADLPSPTVPTYPSETGACAGFVRLGWYEMKRKSKTKPDYKIPTMAEIAKTKPNGFTIVSTFTGAGGSCLGFKMAGFRALWASEFIEAARKVYESNFPGVPVDARDIRKVKPSEILRVAGMKQGQVDVLEGSPPCASFSTAGRRERSWGQIKNYSETRQRVDDLFFEFVRIVDGVKPRVFIAENVSGLVKGTAKGYFKEILREMKAIGYRVEAKVLDAQWLGVPQHRERLIFVGVRDDLNVEPAHPKP